MANRKVASVSFEITGEYITEHYRESVESGEWRQSLQSLQECIHGLDYGMAMDIISGKKKLIGSSREETIDLVDDDDSADYINRVKEYYGAILYHEGEYWVLDKVARNCAHAVLWAGENNEKSRCPLAISKWWCLAGSYDLHCTLESIDGTMALAWWRKCTMVPPPFISDNKDRQDVFAEALKTAHKELKLEDSPLYDTKLYRKSTGVQATSTEVETIQSRENKEREEYELKLKLMSESIWEQNGTNEDDIITLNVYDEDDETKIIDTYKVAAKPLKNWALGRSYNLHHFMPSWECISHSGFKMYSDNPNHTDWVISAGVDPSEIYDKYRALNDAAYLWKFNFECSLRTGNLSMIVPCRGSIVKDVPQILHKPRYETNGGASRETFEITSNIVVIPDASMQWAEIARRVGKRGGIIICQTGGAMSHLSMKGDEYGITLMYNPRAMQIFNTKRSVIIDPSVCEYRFPFQSEDK